MNDIIAIRLAQISDVVSLMRQSPELLSAISCVAQLGLETLRGGGKLLFAGNGGSAADSQHLAGELVSRFGFDRPGLPGIALTTDTSVLTAVGNDYGYQDLFSRQVQALGRAGDLLIVFSTSGRSPNILKALDTAREMGLSTVGLTGASGGNVPERCDYCLRVPHQSTPRIQEGHIVIGHILCELIEREMFPDCVEKE